MYVDHGTKLTIWSSITDNEIGLPASEGIKYEWYRRWYSDISLQNGDPR